MKKLRLFILICMVFGISLALIYQRSASAVEPIKLVYSSFCLENCVQEEVDKWYMAEVEKRTKGRVKFTKHFGGELTKGLETLPAVRTGAVDLSNPPPGYFPDELPLAGVMNVVRIPRDWKTCLDGGYRIYWQEGKISKSLEEEGKKQNIKYLYQHPMDYFFLTKKPVHRLADLKGMKMRSTGLFEPKHLATWDVLSVNVLPAEWYEALSRGTIDGISICADMATDYKLQEVAKWGSFHGGAILARPLVINLNTWNKLPPEVRKVMEDLRQEVHRVQWKAYPKKMEEVNGILKASGVQMFGVDSKEQEEVWNAWIKVSIDAWLPLMQKKGLGTEANLLINRWLELSTGKGLEVWQKQFPK